MQNVKHTTTEFSAAIRWTSELACNLAIVRSQMSAEEGRNDKKCLELHGGDKMVYVTFWALNPNVPPSKIAEVADCLRV